MKGSAPEGGRGAKVRRWTVALVLVGAATFALLGGTYTTFDVFRLRADVVKEQEAIALLKVTIDSLGKVAQTLERDPATQERMARDQFGMIREGEHLYRIVPGVDTTGEQ